MATLNRRSLLRHGGVLLAGAGAGATLLGGRALGEDAARLPFGNGERPLVSYPGKRPLLQMTARPPQLETPFAVFNEGVITPNNAFFVRYHLAEIPLSIDPDSFRLDVGGKVSQKLS